MRLVSFDLETHLLQPGLLAPPIVCGSTAAWEGGRDSAELLERDGAKATAYLYLANPDVTIAGANIAFDFGCLAHEDPKFLRPIFRAYEEQRVVDVQVLQALDAIAGGHLFCEPDGSPLIGANGKHTKRYSLATCTRLTLGRDDAKANDFWRLRYAILARVPMELWPEQAVQYPKDDAWNTVEVAAAQLGLMCERCGQSEHAHAHQPGVVPGHQFIARPAFRNVLDLPAQAETAFAMHLGAMWGITPDRERTETLIRRVGSLHDAHVARFREAGFIRADGVEDQAAVKRAVAAAYGASGTCKVCDGDGKHRKVKRVKCRGTQARKGARWSKCRGVSCPTCNGTGEVDVPGNLIICKASEGGCDGTGFDLATVPALPRTDTGGISADRDTLAETGDETLGDYGDNEHEKVRDSYVPFLLQGWGAGTKESAALTGELMAAVVAGGHLPDELRVPINLRPNVLVATTRTSYDGVIQLIPRSCPACIARLPGCTCVRPCLRAREGRVFGSADYSAGELCTLAQVCLWVVGASEMANTINRTHDPGALHTALGAKMLGISEAEGFARYAAKDPEMARFRQAAKPFNFGAPGGMGAAKLVLTNRRKAAGSTTGPDGRVYSGIRFCILVGGAQQCGVEKVTTWKKRDIPPTCKACLELAEYQLRPAWFDQWPEMREYFAWVSQNVEQNGGELPFFGPNEMDGWSVGDVVRGGLDFCNGANNGFQALLARGAKAALRAVTREAYTDETSPLYQGVVRVIFFPHDELFHEGDAETAHLWAPRVSEVMVRELRRYVPDVYCHADTAIMSHWYKDAKPVYDEAGKLVPWRPKT